MTESYINRPDNNTTHKSSMPTADELGELRSLLLGPELQERLDKAKLRAEDVSQVLPEAIILRTMQKDEQLTTAIVPTVEEAIQSSVKKDLNILTDALFPIIGPATRKAVATAIKTLTQSLNETLEHSLSVQSFKWRLEARQTGKSFAEVVLLRTLIYRVEQVLLIHKQTGLLLQHLVADTATAQDADLVSAMLTAIQDFVQDSFAVQKGDTLENLQFGELTLWIEQGPQAILVGVIRGNAPEELRLVLQETIERIHRKFRSAFNSYNGDPAPFEASRNHLQECLQAQYKHSKAAPSPGLWVLLGSILLASGFWGFVSVREQQRWAAYVEKLNAQPGIVVTKTEKRQGKYYLSGLRDPLAAEPSVLMKQADIDPEQVISQWEPYLSLSSGFVTQRAIQVLQPPQTVSLKVDENGILSATGSAPRQWINETRQLARAMPGIRQFQTDNLMETELKELESYKKQIETQVLLFGKGNAQLEPGQDNTLQTVFRKVTKLTDLAPSLGKHVHIKILGHTDDIGSPRRNMLISQARANTVLSILVRLGIKQTHLSALGVGTTKPVRQGVTEADKKFNRSVTFKIDLNDAENK